MTNEELCKAAADGDVTAVNRLWEQADRLFYMFADRLYYRYSDCAAACGAERDDFQQVSYFAFLDAVTAYNRKPERDVKFSSFAGLHVKRRIYDLLGLRTSKREPLDHSVSLDTPIGDDDGLTIAETLADTTAGKPFEDIENADNDILRSVERLPEKMAAVVKTKFWQDKTLTEIGAELELSPKQASNLYRRAMQKLRRDKRIRQIHDDYYKTANLFRHTGRQFFKENGMSSVEWHLLKLEERLDRWEQRRGGDKLGKDQNETSEEYE